MMNLTLRRLGAFPCLVKSARKEICGCAIILFLVGCAALDTHQAKLDQKQLREVLIDYNEDQILDNLIRAYNGLPIVQFDIKTVTATVASRITPSVTAGRTGASSRYPGNSVATTTTTGPAGAVVTSAVTRTIGSVATAVGTVMRPFSSTVGGERSNNVQVEVKPMDEVNVYAAYIKFLNAAQPSPSTARNDDGLERNKVTTNVTKPTSITTITETKPAAGSTPSVPTETTETKTIEQTISIATEEVAKKKAEGKTGADKFAVGAHSNSPGPGIKPLMEASRSPGGADILVGPKRWRGQCYWVPVQYRKAFFELCLATVTKGVTSAGPSGGAESVPTRAQEQQEELKEELEDFNSLQRLRLGTPP